MQYFFCSVAIIIILLLFMFLLFLQLCTQLDHELLYAPGFQAPPNTDFVGYRTYIDENLPPESPYLYGLHPNAEIGFLTQTSDNLFRTVLEMQPRDTAGAGAAGASREEKVSQDFHIKLTLKIAIITIAQWN